MNNEEINSFDVSLKTLAKLVAEAEKRGACAGWDNAIRHVRAALEMWPNGGGDEVINGHVERLCVNATSTGWDTGFDKGYAQGIARVRQTLQNQPPVEWDEGIADAVEEIAKKRYDKGYNDGLNHTQDGY